MKMLYELPCWRSTGAWAVIWVELLLASTRARAVAGPS
jgi:hypothetical protein